MSLERTLTVRVTRIARQTPEILAFELAHPWGRALPGYEAGAHIDVHMPGGFSRQYSLARAPSAGAVSSYLIGVKREAASRGGSASMHERVREGDLLPISTPRNTFPLQAQARHHLLLAGGIGMTPLLAMAQALAARGISGPKVAEGTGRGFRRLDRLQPGDDLARAAQPIRHQAGTSAVRMALA